MPPPYSVDGFATSSSHIEPKSEGRQSMPSAPIQSGTQNLIYPPPQPNIVYIGLPVRLGDNPSRTMCPNCHANVLTEVKYQSGLLTWVIAGGLCFFGLGCGCCLIPFCIDCKILTIYY